jgi:type IV secretory pathway VirB6-like protein
MNLTKKLIQLFALIFLVFSIASCEEGCIEADEFDVESVNIESNPVKDGIFGSYDAVDGGQRANWHETGLRSNGDRFLIQISGSWTPLQGFNQTALNALPRCNSCAKRYDNTAPNCICYKNQIPTPEKGIDGIPLNVDCTLQANQEDPTKCTCTKQHGSATAEGVFHFPLNILEKNETLKLADDQRNCRYDRGMGAYIALWGSRGVSVPLRAYHLFTEEEICNIVRNSNGACLDAGGQDVTRYVYRSANERIFLKNDGEENNGEDLDSGNDEYHKPNEAVKTVMWDSYYSDNFGKYNIRILRGVGNEKDRGLLEFLVALAEDVLLGESSAATGERKGGIVEFMYKSIVQDSGFILVVQVSLALYIALFGAATLFGVAEISSKKELMNRALKISLIVFFISPSSWYFYNQIVVHFFKDSMDYMVAMMMDLYDSNIDTQTSMIKLAQMDREKSYSSSTRFSYVDLVIKNLMSMAVTKKIFGLFFQSIFGFLYIPLIYALIFGFIYVMLYIASMYVVNLIKIIFVLSLGPIFMVFTLFTKTSGMFKNWLAFLGARALEIMVIFFVLYMFLTILDKNFTDLLYYRVCGENKGLGLFSFIILMADVDRSFMTWMAKFITIGGLLFICYLIIQKIPNVAGSIITIGGTGSSSGFGMAGAMMKTGFDLAKQAGGHLGSAASFAARVGVKGATSAARKSGLADFTNNLSDKIPIRISPRRLMRDATIDGAIKKAQAQAGGKTGEARDRFIRDTARKELQMLMYSNPTKMAMYGVDMKNISDRFDHQLVKEPLKKFIKEEAKRMKGAASGDVKFGTDAQEAVKKAALEWSKKNLVGGSSDIVEKYLDKSKGINKLTNEKTELSSSRAAKMLSGNEDAKARYMSHLLNKEFAQKDDNIFSKIYHSAMGDKMKNPRRMATNFARKVDREENKKPWYKWHKENLFAKINFLDKTLINRDKISKMTSDAQNSVIKDALMKGELSADKSQFMRDKLSQNARNGMGNLTIPDALAAMRTANGKELYEKSAQLAELLSTKGQDFKAHHEKIIDDFLRKQVEAAGKMSTAAALEERARLATLVKMSGVGNIDSLNAKLADTMTAQSAALTAETDRFATVDATNIDAAKATQVLVAQQFEVQFGQSITDALLQQSDIGLKAGSLALGVAPENNSGKLSEQVINALKMNKAQLDAKAKIESMNKRIKEFELQQKKDELRKPDADKHRLNDEIRDLENEISRLDHQANSYKAEAEQLDKEIFNKG